MLENWAIVACYTVRSSLSLVLSSGDDEIAISGRPRSIVHDHIGSTGLC